MKELIKETLEKCGYTENESTILTHFLTNNKSFCSQDIQLELKMQQPLVSIILKKFESYGWLTMTQIPNKRLRGRPVNVYNLASSPFYILTQIYNILSDEQQTIINNMQIIKELMERYK